MTILQEYLHELAMVKQSGMAVTETSYYGKLETLLNKVGAQLKPFVKTIINTRNIGAGLPDGGFFTKDQFKRDNNLIEDFIGTPPSRGAMEIKPTSHDINNISNSSQVERYLEKYGQVLVTNYYQFRLIIVDENANAVYLEHYYLAENEHQFWEKSKIPSEFAKEHEERFIEFLKRVMLHAAPLTEPKDVAWFLASYARDARIQIEHLDLPALQDVKTALEDSLGISFANTKGEHFFKSTLIQTIFYGVFSAWVLYNKAENAKGRFDWRLSGWYLKVPMISALFNRVVNQEQISQLRLAELLDWTANVLNRINKNVFLNKFQESEAVLYFYEPFLEAFDSQLRKELGVWYTPKEVVCYMVEKVDRALREELNIPLGLADERVYVLDPCCGTGAYVVEVLKKIHKTLTTQGSDALIGEDIKEAALNRIFGFEILPAPFVVAHLQLGVLLQNMGVNFVDGSNERPGIYLTNALTDWHPSNKENQLSTFPEMQIEKEASRKIKREKPIIVILGNPPYNAFAGLSPAEEEGLVEPYKEGLISKWNIRKFNLDELYVRFLSIAERKINSSGKGIICYISSFSYTHKESFVVLREKFVQDFSSIWIDSLNGDSRETGKRTPDGKPDPSVFSSRYNPEGIKLGTSISLFIKKENSDEKAQVYFREFWGNNKKEAILQSLNDSIPDTPYQLKEPNEKNLFSFRFTTVNGDDYNKWLRLDEISKSIPLQGLDEDRKFDLISLNKGSLEIKMARYFDPAVAIEDLKASFTGLINDSADFNAKKARSKILNEDFYKENNIKDYEFRAFDKRYCYHSIVNPLWKRSRPELRNQLFENNKFLISRKASSAEPEGCPFYLSKSLFARDAIKGHATAFPFKTKTTASNKGYTQLLPDEFEDNVSDKVKLYLKNLSITESSDIWWHVLAIGFTSNYMKENKNGYKSAYPRIPFPKSKDDLIDSIKVGEKLGDLMSNAEVEGVTISFNSLYRNIAIITSISSEVPNLSLNANWGNKTEAGVMPGKGKYNMRTYSSDENNAFLQAGYNLTDLHKLLGDQTLDIYLNEKVYWKNIPLKVWQYYIGGYQVIKKWLSYREHNIIGRPLGRNEAREVSSIARRLAAILLLQNELNANYEKIKNSYLIL